MIEDEAIRQAGIRALYSERLHVAQRVSTYRGARPIGTATDSRVPTTSSRVPRELWAGEKLSRNVTDRAININRTGGISGELNYGYIKPHK